MVPAPQRRRWWSQMTTALSRDRIVHRLEEIGLETIECLTYLKLLETGPEKASTLAEALDLNRSKIYRVLDTLRDLNVVRAATGTPTLFRARDPDAVMGEFIRDAERRHRTLEEIRSEVVGPLERRAGSQANGNGHAADPFRKTVEGRTAIYRELDSLIRSAETSIRAASTHPVTLQMARQVLACWESAVGRAREGVAFQVVVPDRGTVGDRLIGWAGEPGIEVRRTELGGPIHFVLIDDRVVVAWLHTDASERLNADGDVAMITDAEAIVASKRHLLDAIWRDAPPLEA